MLIIVVLVLAMFAFTYWLAQWVLHRDSGPKERTPLRDRMNPEPIFLAHQAPPPRCLWQ